MFQKNLGDEPAPLYTPYSPYTPASVPGSIPSFIPGSAYSMYGPMTTGAYGKVVGENVVKETYVSNSDENMEGMSMFARGLGADEEFGPPAPTTTQVAVQAARDVFTSEVPVPSMFGSQKNILYIASGLIVAWVLYKYAYPYLASEA